MRFNLFKSKNDEIKPTGMLRGYETELEVINGKVVDTGRIVKGSEFSRKNATYINLKQYIAYKIGTNTTDQAMDALFVSNGAVGSVGAANNGKDGMYVADDTDVTTATYLFTTTLNDGGDNTETYIEFYGYIDGAVTFTNNIICLGFNYTSAANGVAKTYAQAALTKTVAANRRYHIYWKINIA